MNDTTSIGDLIKQLRDDSTTLIRDEVALAKTEMTEKLSVFGRNIGYLIAGALVAYSALVILLIGLGSLIAEAFIESGMDPALGHFLGMAIVAVVVAVIGAALIIKAIHKLKEESLVPKRTMETLKNDKEWAKNQLK